MASDDSAYLPDLNRCLSSDTLLLSWDDILNSLLSHSPKRTTDRTNFFADKSVQRILSDQIPSFPPPSSQSKSAFESKTASITTGTTAFRLNGIHNIKDNALWLSNEMQIDELEALRITVLEWQHQPESRLKAGFSDAELASLRDASSQEYVDSKSLASGGSHSRSDAAFVSTEGLHSRLLRYYFRERVHVLSMASEILQQSVLSSLNPPPNQSRRWQSILETLPPFPPRSLHDTVDTTIESLQQWLEALNSGRIWPVDEENQIQVAQEFATTSLQAIAVILEILFVQIKNAEEPVDGETLISWLRFMDTVEYFTPFQSDIGSQTAAIEQIQVSTSCITIALLDPSSTFASLAQDSSLDTIPIISSGKQDWFIDNDRINDIHHCLLSAAESCNPQASLAVLIWALVLLEFRTLAETAKSVRDSRTVERGIDSSLQDLQARLSSGSSGSAQSTIYEDILAEIMSTNKHDELVEYMLSCATQGADVFDRFARICTLVTANTSVVASLQLQLLQEWIRAIRPSMGYSAELVSSQLLLLAASSEPAASSPVFDTISNFVGDDALRKEFFDVAAARFPYEALPFLRYCKALAPGKTTDSDGTNYVTFRLRELYSFTQAAVDGFGAYRTYREDENANLVALDNAVGMIDFQANKLLTAGNDVQYLNLIPANTIGEVIRESIPPIVRWQISYSGFALLGKWLEMQLQGTLGEALSPFEQADDVAAGVIALLAVLLEATYTNGKTTISEQAAQQLCTTILDDVGIGLDANNDIISCISDLMEQQLQSSVRSSDVGSGHEILIACIDFFAIYAKIQPQQAWAALIRSSAFGAKGTRQNLPTMIASIEVPSGYFGLLESCSKLLEVVTDLMLVVSFQDEDQTLPVKALKEGKRTASQRLNGSALLSYSETMYAAFESISAWIFNSREQKERIAGNLASGFYKILYYAFGTGEEVGELTSLSASLIPAAKFIVHMMQEADITATGTGPLIPLLVSMVVDNDLWDASSTAKIAHARPILSLCDLLVRYSQRTPEEHSQVSSSLFNLMPVIARLPFLDPTLWSDCHELLTSLLPRAASSVLGHLGSTSCIAFLDCIQHASQTTTDGQLESRMWDLLSRLVTVDQQWLAIALITGSPPGKETSSGSSLHKTQTRGKPVLQKALDQLTETDLLDPKVSAAVLQFVGEAQQNWLSVTDSITSRKDLFPHLIKYVSGKHSHGSNSLDQALHNKVAAGVVDLAIIHLHRLMALKDEKVFSTFIPLLNWLTNNAVEVGAYNKSLHANLKKNFGMKYRGLDATSIKRSGLLEVPYGDSYFYNISLADTVLAFDPFWRTTNRQQSFSSEFQRANLNLSVVDSEFVLLRSLERLCIEHGKFFCRNRDVARIMAQIVRNCLNANMRVTPSEALFDTLFQTRADLAIVLVRPLAAAKYTGSDFSALLTSSWDATRFRNGSYEMAIANDDLIYWRSMLSVLVMSMSFRVDRKLKQANVLDDKNIEKIDPFSALYCEIAIKIVGEGLKSVVIALQDQHQTSTRRTAQNPPSPSSLVGVKDVALLLNMLQTIIRMPSISQFAVQISDALTSTGTGQSALLLYSWSHLLLDGDEPVYADFAARFLASVSSLPRVAEELAVEGVLNRLLTARVTQMLQNIPNGVSHLDRRPLGGLLYALWAQGMVPLSLNLLHAIGGGVAGEVSGFLNAFPNQLARASLAMSSNPAYADEGAGRVTMKMVSEISTLSLISFVLSRFRDAGASAGVDPSMIQELKGFDEYKKSLAEDVRDYLGLAYAVRKKKVVLEGGRERVLQSSMWKKKDYTGKDVPGDRLDDLFGWELNGAKAGLLGEDEAGFYEEGGDDGTASSVSARF